MYTLFFRVHYFFAKFVLYELVSCPISGTGKTMTLVECVLQVFSHVTSSRILVATPSNSAADLISQRLHRSGLLSPADLVRLNAFRRSEEVALNPTLTIS